MGYLLCSAMCEDKYGRQHISMSAAVDSRDTYLIDGQGVVWEGMPDDPEPCCHLKDLPVYKEHPEKQHYHRFPLSVLRQQLGLLHQPKKYTCFVCGEEHAAPGSPWQL